MFQNLQKGPRPSEAAEIIVGVTELPAGDRELQGVAERYQDQVPGLIAQVLTVYGLAESRHP